MRQVLPVVGAAIGAYFGGAQGAQIGWAIGSVIGNAVDPEVIKGPAIGDLAQQTSQEGGPRAIVFALSQPIAGNIVFCSNPKIVTKDQQSGKGGPVQETQSVYRTYAIGICEGPISAIIRVWKNGKLVYDARPGGDSGNNTKFLGATRIFLGGYDQMPSPDIEALVGAGNAPAHRGTCYIVRPNEDLTDVGGAVPQFVFQVLRCEGDFLTSRPYPMLYQENIGWSLRPTTGDSHKQLEQTSMLDSTRWAFAPSTGQLRALLRTMSFGPDNMRWEALTPQTGILKTTLRGFAFGPDNIRWEGLAPSSGQLKKTLITYTDWPPDNIQYGFAPRSGALT